MISRRDGTVRWDQRESLLGPLGTRDDVFPAGCSAAAGEKAGAELAGSKTSDYRSYIEHSLPSRRQRWLHAGAIRSELGER